MTCHHHHHHISHGATRKESIIALRKTLCLIALFMVFEFVFGILSNSLALITDALHMFTDAGAILLSLFAFWIAKRPANKKLSYGYHRAEIIAALVSAFSTWGLSAWLIYEAIQRLAHPEPVKGPMVLIVASVGFCANLAMMMILHKSQKDSLNVRGAYVHIFGDLLGSLGVVASGILLIIFHWYPVDAIITLLFSLIVIYSAWKLVKDTLHVLMEGTPTDISPEDIEKDLLALPNVEAVHDLHVWSLTLNQVNLSAHLISKDQTKTLIDAQKLLLDKYDIKHATLQIEPTEGYKCTPCAFAQNAPLS